MSDWWIDLYGPCPVCLKVDENFYWQHSGCDYNTEINTKGIIRCQDCYLSGNMFHWRFKCGRHGHNYYQRTSQTSLGTMLGLMLQLGKASPTFINLMAKNLKE